MAVWEIAPCQDRIGNRATQLQNVQVPRFRVRGAETIRVVNVLVLQANAIVYTVTNGVECHSSADLEASQKMNPNIQQVNKQHPIYYA